MKILVTGDNGMIGSQLITKLVMNGYEVVGLDRSGENKRIEHYTHFTTDLSDKDKLKEIVSLHKPDRFIHLAALAHTEGEPDLTWKHYYHVNVECSKNVFSVAGDKPLLFISTIDVFGFYDGKQPVCGESAINPVSNYGKSKAMAEEECKKLPHYTIFRLSPVYSDKIKRDIQKRYYLKYPTVAYKIGKGSSYEVLNIKKAISAMLAWCTEKTNNNVIILKDDELLWTPDCIKEEKASGRAMIVLHFPSQIVKLGYFLLRILFGENEKTYLLNKAVYPLRSDNSVDTNQIMR